WNADDPARPIAVVDVACSAGTYVRALARDLGAAVGSAAYLGALVRTASGPFALADAVALDELRRSSAEGPDGLRPLLLPADAGLDHLASVNLTVDEVRDAAMGRFVRPRSGIAGIPQDAPVRLLDESGRIVGIGALDGPRIAPAKMLSGVSAPAEPGDPEHG
ncbi:MAG: tRNA pseudouridine(55) synthase TruB, partial [Candidatus Limnocylindrales bacterium]